MLQEFDGVPVSKLTVAKLRTALKERGLDTKGLKAVLVQRLSEALAEATSDSEPAVSAPAPVPESAPAPVPESAPAPVPESAPAPVPESATASAPKTESSSVVESKTVDPSFSAEVTSSSENDGGDDKQSAKEETSETVSSGQKRKADTNDSGNAELASHGNDEDSPARKRAKLRRTYDPADDPKLATRTIQIPAAASPTPVVKQVSSPTSSSSSSSSLSASMPSPPRDEDNMTSIEILGFVRPFRPKAVPELLTSKAGAAPTKHWMDRFRTRCRASFSSVDEARQACAGIHGLKWPPSNPLAPTLRVKYISEQEVDDAIAGKLDAAPKPSPKNGSGGRDQNKLDAAADGDEDHKVREIAANLDQFEGLFRKTKVKPVLYFLPLTEEEVEAKLARGSGLDGVAD